MGQVQVDFQSGCEVEPDHQDHPGGPVLDIGMVLDASQIVYSSLLNLRYSRPFP